MSRLFPERLRVRLAPTAVTVRAGKREQTVPCDPAYGPEPWQGALAALDAAELDFPCRVTVILANALVRYAVLPWNDELDGPAEEEAYVRHHFARIHGERAKTWAVRAAEGAPATRLASAIDRALLDGLKASFARRRSARLVSVQPELMQRFNAARSVVPSAGAWLVLAEPERACIALHASGGWRTVASGKGDWLALLERERLRLGGEQPALVLLAGAQAPKEAPGWTFRMLAPA